MTRLLRSGSSKSMGQALVEFSLASMIFFVMLFGIIEGGRLLFTYHEITSAAREGARFASAQGFHSGNVSSTGPVQDHVESVTTGIDWDQFTLAADWPGDETCGVSDEKPELNRPGCPVIVSVTYQYEPVLTMAFGAGTITLQSESKMRIHY